MKTCRAIPLFIAALSVSACGLPTRPDRVEHRHSSYDTTISISLDRAPPAPLVEYPPQIVVKGHFWAPGYWSWQGARHSWVSGNWQPERPGYTHVASHWERRGDRWHFEPGRYEEHRAARTFQTRQTEERAPARHTEHLAAAKMPEAHAMERREHRLDHGSAPRGESRSESRGEHRSEHRHVVPSVGHRTDPSPGARPVEKSRTELKPAAPAAQRGTDPASNVKTIEKPRTEVAQNAKTAEKATPGKASTTTAQPKEERDLHKIGHAPDRGDANESRERRATRDGGNRL